MAKIEKKPDSTGTTPSGARPHAPSRLRRRLKRAALVLVGLLAVPALEVSCVSFVDPGVTGPMIVRRIFAPFAPEEVPAAELTWVPLSEMARAFPRAVVVSEDHHFYEHHGFDWKAIEDARAQAARTGRPSRGASTITQQCARSLFLWQARSWPRKGLEAYYTAWMEALLSKQRILELYLNVIELGDGIYGVEAAARHYYHVHARRLTVAQVAMLVAILPSPREWSPLRPSARVLRRQGAILRALGRGGPGPSEPGGP